MSMLAVSDAARLVGVDQVHIGTVIGKLESPREEVLALRDNLQQRRIEPSNDNLGQNWQNIKPVFPTCSGGLHPGLVPELMELVGSDIIIQAGGGVWGHPDGGKAGAMALRQAIDAAIDEISLEDAARKQKELRRAIDTWGVSTYK
jgi:ribulose-bisphosphate carboxylase large chain